MKELKGILRNHFWEDTLGLLKEMNRTPEIEIDNLQYAYVNV